MGDGGFLVGGSYAKQNDAGTMNGESYDAGVSHTTSPWGFSITYFHGENVDDESVFSDEELDQFLIGLSYSLAKGVNLGAYCSHLSFDEEFDDSGESGGDDVEAYIIGTGIRIDF